MKFWNVNSTGSYSQLMAAYLILMLAVALTADYSWQYLLISSMMLLLPFFDSNWRSPQVRNDKAVYILMLAVFFITVVVLVLQPDMLEFMLMTLLFAALPEEWFFRAYLMPAIGAGVKANLITSLLFSLLHALSWNWITGLLVFIPSIIFGWVYQKTGSLLLVVFIHALSNLFYIAYLQVYMSG